MRPSFLGFIANAILMTIILILVIKQLFFEKTDNITTIYLLMGLSIVIAMHTLHHYIEEIIFKFNPLRGKWTVEDEPM